MNLRLSGLALLLLPFLAWAQDGTVWLTERITVNEGLPQNTINALAMDSLGYLWITTEGGLVRHDGQVLKRFDLPGKGAPRSDRLRALLPTPSGELVATDARGTVYAIHGHYMPVPIVYDATYRWPWRGGVPSFELVPSLFSGQGTLPLRDEWGGEPYVLLPFDANRWCALANDRLYFYQDTLLLGSEQMPAPGMACFIAGEKAIGMSADGRAWSFSPKGDRAPIPLNGWPSGTTVTAVRSFWRAGEPHGLLHIGHRLYLAEGAEDGTRVQLRPIGPTTTGTDRITDALWDDERGLLFVGTLARGLLFHHRSSFTQCVRDSMTDASTSVLAVRSAGRGAWASIDHHIALVDDRGHVSSTAIRTNGTFFTTLPDGRVLHSHGPRVLCVNEALTEQDTLFQLEEDEQVRSALVEGDSIWVAGDRSLGLYAGGRYKRLFLRESARIRDAIFFIQRGPDGALWMGSCGGLHKLDEAAGTLHSVAGAEGICFRTMQRFGDIWLFGSYGDGMFLLVDGRFVRVPDPTGGRMRHVHAFMRDGHGHLWWSSNHGLFRVNEQALQQFARDNHDIPYIQYFGPWSGVTASEFNGGVNPAAAQLADGRMLFPGIDGFVMFDPTKISTIRPLTDMLFEDTWVDGLRWSIDRQLILPAGTRQVAFDVSSTFWGDPFNLQVQYRMQGWSDAWVPLDPKLRSLVFNNLPTGHYTLQFRMSDTGWTPDVGMPSISFLIERHWHEEIWARSMFVLIALLLLLLLFPRFTRRARRRQQALELAVQERTRLLSDANDELRALVEVKDRLVSIISHDIVSPLRFIARVVRHGQNRPRGETEQAAAMADIADATEKLYSNAQNLLSWMKQQGGKIEPRPVHVAMAPFLDDAFRQVHGQARNKGITLINRIGADDVLLVDRDLLSIVVNNLLINALNNMNQGGITVEGINATDHYILRITDDGPGIPEPALARIEQIRAGVREPEAGLLGMGYIIVFDLLRLMGGGIDIRTAASEGTAIALTLPTEVDQS